MLMIYWGVDESCNDSLRVSGDCLFGSRWIIRGAGYVLDKRQLTPVPLAKESQHSMTCGESQDGDVVRVESLALGLGAATGLGRAETARMRERVVMEKAARIG